MEVVMKLHVDHYLNGSNCYGNCLQYQDKLLLAGHSYQLQHNSHKL